jgi:hypothetical protein
MIDAMPGHLGQITGARLQDADLLIEYELDKLPEESFFYEVQFSIGPVGDRTFRIPATHLLGNYDTLTSLPDGKLQIIWRDATEQGLLYSERYELSLKVGMHGDPGVDCAEPRPAFGLNEQWPHYLGGAVGAGLIILGQVYDNQASSEYDNYEDLWKKGALLDQADPLRGKAVKQHRTSEGLAYAGIAILVLDAAWMTYRAIHIRKKQRMYDRYCTPANLTISPKINLSDAVNGPSIGWQMAWRF